MFSQATPRSTPRRLSTSVAAVIVLIVATVPFGSADSTVYEETWDDGLTGWTVEGDGVSSDCTTAFAGCSLAVGPSCCSTWTKAYQDVDIPLTSGDVTVSFLFRGSTLYGPTDSAFSIFLPTHRVDLFITDGSSVNNGVKLHSTGFATDAFGSWPSSGTWYESRITVNGGTDTIQAELRTLAGDVLATSAVLPIDASADRITRLQFGGVEWSSSSAVYHYDELTITTPASPGADSTPPWVRITSPEESGVYVVGWKMASVEAAPTTAVGRLVVEVDAGDADTGVARVEFRVDGILRHIDHAEDHTWYWDTSFESTGSHHVEVTAVDNAGNRAVDAIEVFVTGAGLP